MAASMPSCSFHCNSASAHSSTPTSRFSSSPSAACFNRRRISLGRLGVEPVIGFKARAKFEKFQDEAATDNLEGRSEPYIYIISVINETSVAQMEWIIEEKYRGTRSSTDD
ncbi:hypothetical protein CRG98_028096 [Punica granatum]|uniref:Uncharacterized protein n=1 Tax=Punica granatum TaxID=22663 RepID=A0A2I0J758_PUNGR|nr:hypothetical protein CRG98_028096 [Punica granatum]